MNIEPTSFASAGAWLNSPHEGIQRGLDKAQQAADLVAAGDTFSSAIALIESTAQVQANVASARALDETHGTLLNVKS